MTITKQFNSFARNEGAEENKTRKYFQTDSEKMSKLEEGEDDENYLQPQKHSSFELLGIAL